MDWPSYERFHEDAEYGSYLIETIAEAVGCEPVESLISKAIYKGTRCGAWVKFDEKGIVVGTIVEGSEAEFRKRVVLSDDPKELAANFWAALERCEEFSGEVWAQMDAEEEDE